MATPVQVVYVERKPRSGCVGLGCGGILVVGLLVMLLVALLPHDSTTPATSSADSTKPEPPRNLGEDAYYLGRLACQKSLKSPSTARFSNPRSDADTGWQPDGYFQWLVFGHVDAQNGFGAMLRQDWVAVVQVNTGRLEVVYLKLGETASGKRPPMRRAPVLPGRVAPTNAVAAKP